MKTQPFLAALVSSALAFTLCACYSSDSPAPVTPVEPHAPFDYQALLDNAVEGEIPGAVLYIDSPQLYFYGSAGIADIEQSSPMQLDARMPNGSAGKKLTALLVAMLVEQNRLDLDHTVSTYLPQSLTARIPYASEMTIRQLLQHTAGLFDYLNDSDGAFYDAVLAEPDSIKTDDFALSFVLDQPANFSPGQGWGYSNTGYILAGLILDQVLGEHHFKTLRSLILEPLGLTSMSYGGLEKAHGPIVSGYFKLEDELLNTRQYYQNIGVADAPIVGDAKDMASLLKMLVEGSHLSDATHQLLVSDASFIATGIDNLTYSYGLFKQTINGKQVFHHGGSELGYATYNAYIPGTQTTLAMLVNCNGYQACDEQHQALYNQIINQLTQ